jgi:hypothetical protein
LGLRWFLQGNYFPNVRMFGTFSTNEFPGSRENNRTLFELAPKSGELCPKSASFNLRQGLSRAFCGYIAKPALTLNNAAFCQDSKNQQGISREFFFQWS